MCLCYDLRVIMAFWNKQKNDKYSSIVVAAAQGESIYAIRGYRSHEERVIKIQGSQVFSMDNIQHFPMLLKEKLNWCEGEAVYFAKQSPLLFGKAFSVTAPRYEEGHPVILDSREVTHRLKWQAADLAREEAANFFGCTLEEIDTRGFTVEHWHESTQEIRATLFQTCMPRWQSNHNNFAVPEGAREFILPIVLAQEVGSGDEPEAILHTEYDGTFFAIRKNNILEHFRSFNLGAATARNHLQNNFQCSAGEAEVLMQSIFNEKLSKDTRKVTLSVLRQLLPLWAGMFTVGVEGIPKELMPRKLMVTGLFSNMIARVYCRPQLISRWSHLPVKLTTLAGESDSRSYLAALKMALKKLTRESADVKIPAAINFGLSMMS
jgi:hypothetical protein